MTNAAEKYNAEIVMLLLIVLSPYRSYVDNFYDKVLK